MEKRKVVSRILELQNSAAKSSTLESQNDEYAKRTNDLEEEIRRLRNTLKQVDAEKNTFERDIAVYVTENKNLNKQLEVLKNAHENNASTSARLLHEIKDGNKKLMTLRENEFEYTLDKMKQEMATSKSEWTEKLKALEKKNSDLRREKQDAEKKFETMHTDLDTYKNKAQISTSAHESTKQKLSNKSNEVQELDKKVKEMENKLSEAKETNSSSTMKLKIQIQAMESKIKKSEDNMNKLKDSHKEEVSGLQLQLEEREKQLGAQSNIGKRIQKDLKSETESLKQEIADKEAKNKELSNQISRLDLRVKSLTDNLKHSDEETKVKFKCLKEQSSVLQKEVAAKTARIEELQSELIEAHSASSDELQDLKNKVVLLKNDKRSALNKANELTEELESLKRGLNRELESTKESYKQEIEKIKRDFTEKEKRSAAQSCISRKVQEDIKRQLENGKSELEKEKFENNQLTKEIKRLELQLKSAQDSVQSLEDDKTLKLKLSEEQLSALQQELAIKNKKMHDLQKQLLEAQEINGKDTETMAEKLATVRREKNSAQDKITDLMEEVAKLERLKSKLEISNKLTKQKHETASEELNEMTKKFDQMKEKCVKMERDIETQSSDSDLTVKTLKNDISQLNSEKLSLQEDLENKNHLEKEFLDTRKKLSVAEKKIEEAEKKLKTELKLVEKEKNDVQLNYKQKMNELEEKLSETQRKLASKNITSVTMCKKVEEDCQKQLQEMIESEKRDTEKLKNELEDVTSELEVVKEEKAAIEEKFEVLRESCSVIETLEEQLDEYHEKCQQLQEQNTSLIEKLAVATREKGGANRKVEKYESESALSREKMEELEKAVDTLKQTCVMMEEQIVGLEEFNNQLVKNQEELLSEKEKLTKESRDVKKKLGEFEHMVAMEKRKGVELRETNDEEVIELQVKVREEANKVHELQDEFSDLDRKYKLLEMQANTLQQKLNSEKELSERHRFDAENSRNRMETLESIRQQTSNGLRSEIERADALAHEKIALQNELDNIKMKQSHDSIKLNCTIGQQSKLIDFLQAKVESLEPQDKKKKKKKNDLYQVPLQYRELQDMLEESKQTNIQLQEKVNNMRTELQNAKSDVSRLKHGIKCPSATTSSHTLSPGSIAAISALVRSPNSNLTTPTQPGNSRSKPRMHHNIPHRLVENLCAHATKCSVCLDTVRFGRFALRCTECQACCHVKCRSNMTGTCGLPGGLVQHYKQGGKTAAASPVSCVTAAGEEGNAQGWLKVFCGGSSWERKWVQLRDGVVIIGNTEKPMPSKKMKMDVSNKDREVIDLIQQQGYVHATVSANELEISAKADVPYVFKLELGPDTSCWPPRNLYFLSSGFTDKQKWVAALESITTRNTITQNTISDSKINGNKIVTMQVRDKLEINCSLPISKEKVLFGCDEGLFLLSPSTKSVCDRSHMIKIAGAQQILQMEFLKSPNLIVAIEGVKRRIVTFDVGNLISESARPSEMSVKLIQVDDITDCHLFAIGSVEGSPHLCSASATHIKIHRFNNQLGKFIKRKEIATAEPSTCLQFTMCSIIMGTNKFYEIELKSYKVDEFLNMTDRSLEFDFDSFPVSILQIGQKNGKYEYLLCYHEFGVFVDCFGKRTRKDNIPWSRLPLSFAYKSPYLIVTHFYSVEIIRISTSRDYNDNLTMQQSYINLQCPRYLGPAITEGAVYLSSNEGGRITVFCCKGNMPESDENNDIAMHTPKSCLKRRRMQLAASSQESLDEDGARAKRPQRSPSIDSSSTILSDTTNVCESLNSYDTSRWTLESKVSQFPIDTPLAMTSRRFRNASYDSLDSIGTSDTTYSKFSEDDVMSCQSSASSRVMWKPVTPGSGRKQAPEKPARKAKTPNKLRFDPVDV